MSQKIEKFFMIYFEQTYFQEFMFKISSQSEQ